MQVVASMGVYTLGWRFALQVLERNGLVPNALHVFL